MKIRSGFVSNSSSSSFIINYPKGILRLKDVEDYFGGYNEDIPDHLKDIVSYVLWKSQFDNENFEISDSLSYNCKLLEKIRPYDLSSPSYELAEKCPKSFDYPVPPEESSHNCEGCKYWQIFTDEDFFNRLIEEAKQWDPSKLPVLEVFKKDLGRVRRISIDDDEPSEYGLTFEEATEIHSEVGNIFKSHDKIIEESI